MRKLLGLVLSIGIITLASCGGSSGGDPIQTDSPETTGATSPASSQAPGSPTPSVSTSASLVITSTADIIAALNTGGFECSNPQPDSGAPGVEETVCTHAGTQMVVDFAESKQAMDDGIALGKQYGLTDARVVRGGDQWAVIATSTADVPAIRAALKL